MSLATKFQSIDLNSNSFSLTELTSILLLLRQCLVLLQGNLNPNLRFGIAATTMTAAISTGGACASSCAPCACVCTVCTICACAWPRVQDWVVALHPTLTTMVVPVPVPIPVTHIRIFGPPQRREQRLGSHRRAESQPACSAAPPNLARPIGIAGPWRARYKAHMSSRQPSCDGLLVAAAYQPLWTANTCRFGNLGPTTGSAQNLRWCGGRSWRSWWSWSCSLQTSFPSLQRP